MSFSAGVFSISTTGQPVVAGTVISDSVFNAFTADIATGLSTCMLKDGTQTATAGIGFFPGTVSLPGIYLGTDTQTGLYRIGSNHDGYAVAGVKVLDIASTGLKVSVGSDGLQVLGGAGASVRANETFQGTDGSSVSKTWFTGINVASTDGSYDIYNSVVGITAKISLAGSVTFLYNVIPQALLDISGSSAGQIKFPATQNASSDVNTLDDYEEGTWTAGIAFGGASASVTYSAQGGEYIKIGKMVYFHGFLTLTNKGISTGNATITGLTFAAGGTANKGAVANVLPANLTLTGIIKGFIVTGAQVITLYNEIAGTAAPIADTAFANNTVLDVSGCYST